PTQHVEVAHHPSEGGGVADVAVESRRAAEVGEEEGEAADGDLLAGPEDLRGEEVTEALEGGDLRRRGRLVRPPAMLDEHERLLSAQVGQLEDRARADLKLALRPAVVRENEVDRRRLRRSRVAARWARRLRRVSSRGPRPSVARGVDADEPDPGA